MIYFIGDLLTSGAAAHVVAGALLLFGGAAFALCGTALALIDLREHRLPNRILYPWAAVTMGLLMVITFLLTDGAGLGRALAAGALWALVFAVARLIHPPSIGWGDIKLSVVLGLYSGFLGWETFISAVAVSFLLGGVVSVALLATRRARSSSRVAFGPFLIIGTAAALIFS